MGAMAPPPHWVPEDDVLLKNAVEAGASLESLARGAVQFSRRFTVQELQDRWFSLLYDPVVSLEASNHMIEVERSAYPNQLRPHKFEIGKERAGKRKPKSVRKCYYAMRKRICNEPFDIMGINLFPGPAYSIGPDLNIGHQSLPENGVAPAFFTGVQNQGQDGAHNLSYPYGENMAFSEVPKLSQSKELGIYNFFEANGCVNEGSACSEFVGLPFNSFRCTSSLTTWQTSQEISAIREKDGPTSTEDYFAELSSTLFDLADTDQLHLMDNDAKDAIEKSYLDGLSSLLLDSPSQCELPSVDGLREVVVAAKHEHFVDTSGAHKGPIVKSLGPEYRNGVIYCTLNTEDLEIPSNDDVFLPFRCPSPTNSHWRLHEPSYLASSSSANDFSASQKAYGGPLMMKNNSFPERGSSQPSDMGPRYPNGDHGVKFELPRSNIQHAALRNARNNECPNHLSSENVNANSYIAGGVKGSTMEMLQEKNINCKSIDPFPDVLQSGFDIEKNLKDDILNNGSSNADLSSQQTITAKTMDQPLLSDQGEPWSENEFDVPYFSDVEAMILDMDLNPNEFDLYSNQQVKRYQHEETKRTIIRLEQAADAFTQRTIAAQGAFAVLYSRCSKYFIEKPQVLLGRATDDIKVDIDLGGEKNGGKISRKQAIVEMDMDGNFHLKNLGKSSIYVNGKEVAPGQSLSLTSRCLIEVRGLNFIFEMNHKSIKQYADSIRGEGVLPDHKPSSRR